jgi:aspartate-semialdehyde dehydrogenase
VPLIIPEINFTDYDNNRSNIIANPNCSTIILAILLNPFILNNFPIKRIVISTYQAASGSGKIGLQELKVQANDYVNGIPITSEYWKQQYIFNTFIHNSPIDTNKYCQEENKLINETNKIFKTKIGISPTCVRVPVLRSHCSSVNIEFDKPISFEQLINLLNSSSDTLEIINNADTHEFPTSISSNNSHLVQVGHIRPDHSLETNKGWNFWISGDQLLRGAAYNAFMIMNGILKN